MGMEEGEVSDKYALVVGYVLIGIQMPSIVEMEKTEGQRIGRMAQGMGPQSQHKELQRRQLTDRDRLPSQVNRYTYMAPLDTESKESHVLQQGRVHGSGPQLIRRIASGAATTHVQGASSVKHDSLFCGTTPTPHQPATQSKYPHIRSGGAQTAPLGERKEDSLFNRNADQDAVDSIVKDEEMGSVESDQMPYQYRSLEEILKDLGRVVTALL